MYSFTVWNSDVFLSPSSLPKVVKRRVNALKNLQVKCAHIEAKFYEEVHELERKYAALYQPLFDKVGTPQLCSLYQYDLPFIVPYNYAAFDWAWVVFIGAHRIKLSHCCLAKSR